MPSHYSLFTFFDKNLVFSGFASLYIMGSDLYFLQFNSLQIACFKNRIILHR